MRRLLVAVVVVAALVGPVRAEEKPAAEPKADAPKASEPAARRAPDRASKKPEAKAAGTGEAPATAGDAKKDGAAEKPCEPVKPCPIDG